MNFLDYQHETAKTAVYPCGTTIEALSYLGLGLASEAGEVAGKLKKVLRDEGGAVTMNKKSELADEISDVMWYISEIATHLGFNLEAIAERNVKKLRDRAERGALQGSGDNR